MALVEIHALWHKDLSASEKIFLPAKLVDEFCVRVGSRLFASVKVSQKEIFVLEVQRTLDDVVRMGLTMRTLINCPVGKKIEILKPEMNLALPEELVLSPIHKIWRYLGGLQERLLQQNLGAPLSIFRTSMTYPGDDDRSLVRIHPSLFPRLGIKPGDQVFVERAGRKIAVVAFEEQLDENFKSSVHVKKNQNAGLETPDLPKDFPPYLVARVSPQARKALGIPTRNVSSVVAIKRRVRTQIVSEFNKMILPITILVLGVIPADIKFWIKLLIYIIGVPIIIAVGLAPLKIRQIPKGLWP